MIRRRSKFNNRKTVVEGYTFDSGKEAARWLELRLLEKAGAIMELRRQVRVDLHADGGAFVGFMKLDFSYFDTREQHQIYEDSKGFVTPFWRWKANHFKAQFGCAILET
jgi:hypothetical protein